MRGSTLAFLKRYPIVPSHFCQGQGTSNWKVMLYGSSEFQPQITAFHLAMVNWVGRWWMVELYSESCLGSNRTGRLEQHIVAVAGVIGRCCNPHPRLRADRDVLTEAVKQEGVVFCSNYPGNQTFGMKALTYITVSLLVLSISIDACYVWWRWRWERLGRWGEGGGW